MTIRIRQATKSDSSAICALLQKVVPVLVPDSAAPGAAVFLESITAPAVTARLAADNYVYFVAESGADLLGYIALRDGLHLYHLFVQPEFQRQGIAHLLWQHLLAVVGQRRITVNSSLPAIPVYIKFGFVPTGEPQHRRCPAYAPMVYASGS